MAVSPVTVDYLTDDSFGSTGKRAYFKYRDLRMSESSAGLAGKVKRFEPSSRSTIRTTLPPVGITTPYRAQFIYVLEGWADLALPGGVIRGLPPERSSQSRRRARSTTRSPSLRDSARWRLRCPQAV